MMTTGFDVDLHVHTSASYDSLQSPKIVVRYAEQRGLDGIAITDHNTFGAHHELEETELMIIPGMEIRTEEYGDLIALFIESEVESVSFFDAVEEIHNQNGLAILPHPFRKVGSYPARVLDVIDGIESLNARSRSETNLKAEELARRKKLPMTAGSDAHTPWEIGRARTVIPRSISSPNEIRVAIQEGDIKPTGSESSYYLYHGLSVGMEMFKKIR